MNNKLNKKRTSQNFTSGGISATVVCTGGEMDNTLTPSRKVLNTWQWKFNEKVWKSVSHSWKMTHPLHFLSCTQWHRTLSEFPSRRPGLHWSFHETTQRLVGTVPSFYCENPWYASKPQAATCVTFVLLLLSSSNIFSTPPTNNEKR